MGEAESDQAAVLDFMASPEAYECGRAALWTASKPTLPWCFWPDPAPTRSNARSNTRFSTFRRLEKRRRALLNELASIAAPRLSFISKSFR